MKKTFYKWILIGKDEFTNENIVVNYGIVDEPIELDVEKVFPNFNYCGDRDLYDMQKFADKNFPDKKYIFRYKEIEIDYSDLMDDED